MYHIDYIMTIYYNIIIFYYENYYWVKIHAVIYNQFSKNIYKKANYTLFTSKIFNSSEYVIHLVFELGHSGIWISTVL